MHKNNIMDLISVIVPIYNSEKFLKPCLDSVINQTYKNLDIILIDDGSTDDSGNICEEYAKNDGRIRVFHKQNGGISVARNEGIQNARGAYITFVDSDDRIFPDMIDYLYRLIDQYQCKMSLCTHTVIWEDGKKSKCMGGNGEERCSSEKCLKRMLYHDVIDTSVWGKLYSVELMDNIVFPAGKLFEDIGTVYKLFIKSQEIACGYQSKYEYRIRKHSITTQSFSLGKLDLPEMTDLMAEEVLNVFPGLKEATLRRRVYARFSTLNQMLDVDGYKHIREEMIKFIKENGSAVLKDSDAPLRDKIAVLLLNYGGYSIYREVWKLVRGNKFVKN